MPKNAPVLQEFNPIITLSPDACISVIDLTGLAVRIAPHLHTRTGDFERPYNAMVARQGYCPVDGSIEYTLIPWSGEDNDYVGTPITRGHWGIAEIHIL